MESSDEAGVVAGEIDRSDGSQLGANVADGAVTGQAGNRLELGVSVLAVAALPVLLFLIFRAQRFYGLSGADPFIYIGYAASPSDLIERFGYTYYSVRFGLILPSNLALEAFGTAGGYFALRWFLSSLAAGAIYFLMRRLYRWELGVLAAIVLLLNPIFVHAVMTMYSTTVGVPAVAAAAALLLVQGRRSVEVASRVASGVLLGTTVSTNLFTVLPIAAMLVAWFGARLIRTRRAAIYELVYVATAAVAVLLIGALIYWHRFGDPDIFGPSITAARRFNSDTVPGTEVDLGWLGFRPEVWLPLLASGTLAMSLVVFKPRPRWHELAACGMPTLMWVSYALHQFVLDGYTLETYYYTSYMWGPTVLAIVMTIGRVAQHHPRPRAVASLSTAAVLLFPVVWTHGLRTMSVWSLNGLVPLAAVTGAALVAARRQPRFALLTSALMAITPLVVALGTPRNVPLSDDQVFRQQPYYDQALFQADSSIFSLYILATDFARSVPREAIAPGSVVFWYDEGDQAVGIVQWTYIGGYSKLQPDGSRRIPDLSPTERRLLEDRTPRFVLVLASNELTIDAAEVSLDALDLEPVARNRFLLERGPYRVFVSVNEYTPSVCDGVGRGEPIVWRSLPACTAGCPALNGCRG